jgi:hypothetical protein
MATKILFTAGKGGTGKSTILFHLIDWLQEAGIEPHLIDTDDNLTLSRFFPHAQKVEVRRSKSLDLIVDTVESGSHSLVIVDHRAGAGYEMVNWYSEVPFEELSEQFDVKFVLIGPVTSSSDSVSSVLHWADSLGKKVRYLIVRNLKDSDAANLDPEKIVLPAYHDTVQAAEFRRRYRPAEIIMPGLDPEYQSELERCNLTIRDVLARHPGVPELLTSLIVRSRLRRYQAYLFEQFDALKELLLP